MNLVMHHSSRITEFSWMTLVGHRDKWTITRAWYSKKSLNKREISSAKNPKNRELFQRKRARGQHCFLFLIYFLVSSDHCTEYSTNCSCIIITDPSKNTIMIIIINFLKTPWNGPWLLGSITRDSNWVLLS